jgi:hypothetical protein
VRPGLHLDDRGHAVFFDPGHNARESVPCGLRDDRPRLLLTPLFLEAAEIGECDETLAAG